MKKGLSKFNRLIDSQNRILILRTQYPCYIFEINPKDAIDIVQVTLSFGTFNVSLKKDLNNYGPPPESYYEEAARWFYYHFLPNNPQEISQEESDVFGVSEVDSDLKPLFDLLNGAYVAEKCFDKSRQWLYQRVNGNIVNGKPAEFTEDQKEHLAAFLREKAKELEYYANILEQ